MPEEASRESFPGIAAAPETAPAPETVAAPDIAPDAAIAPDIALDGDSQTDAFQPIAPEDAPAAIEALLFAAGDPLNIEQIARILGLERSHVRRILDGMAERHQRDRSRGLELREADGTFTLATKPSQKEILARLLSPRNRPPLSAAAYETLAIIAYNQPVTRAQIEAVRGVNSDNVLQRLVERGLVRDAGTLEAPGRPTLFTTTEQFLLDFGLRSVADLPPMEMLMYGTLRDIEQALREAANTRQDRQLTIEQLPRGGEPGPALDPSVSAEVIGMSAALFGTPPETAGEPS